MIVLLLFSSWMPAVCWREDRLSDDVLALTFADATPSTKSAAAGSTQDVVEARQLARSVSHLLRTITRIVSDQSASAAAMTSRAPAPLLLKLDYTRCVAAARCFTAARSAAAFLAVYRARQLGTTLNLTSVAGELFLRLTPLGYYGSECNTSSQVHTL